MLHYGTMIRSKDINQPSPNPIIEMVRKKVLHLGAMFGTEAKITKTYRGIYSLLGNVPDPKIGDLDAAVEIMDRVSTLNPQP